MSLLTQADNIFENRSVLSNKYIPDKLLGREEEIEYVERLVEPLVHDADPLNSFITGFTGIGKTVVVRHVMKTLRQVITDMKLYTVIVNCKVSNTEARVLYDLLRIIAPERNLPKTGISIPQYYDVFWDVLKSQKVAVVVVLDEVDNLKNYDVLYSLSRSVQFIDNPEDVLLGTICVTNDMHYYEKLSPAVTSSFGNRNYIFKPYHADQIIEILNDRAALAFKPNVLDEWVIPLCAAFAAQENGDARMAIELLYHAGLAAKEEGARKVTEKHVRIAQIKLTEDKIAEMISTLPFHVQMVLYVIAKYKAAPEQSSLTTGKVEERYVELCRIMSKDPLTRTSISKMITKLETAGLISTAKRTEEKGGITRSIYMSPEYVRKVPKVLEFNPLFENIPGGGTTVPFSYQKKFI